MAESRDELPATAGEALFGWLEAEMLAGRGPPHPQYRAKAGLRVEVPFPLTVQLQLRRARLDANLTQAELARRAGVTQQAIAKLEHPDGNPTLETLAKAAKAMGATIRIEVVSSRDPAGALTASNTS